MIDEIARRLIDFYQSARVYLFGSAARGESDADSDLDFCVVLPDEAPESLFRDRGIHARFWGLHASVDVVRLRCSDFDGQAAHVVASLPATIVREGTLIYDARKRICLLTAARTRSGTCLSDTIAPPEN